MISVYKYAVPIEDEFQVLMPEGAEVLCVQTQFGQPFMWVRVESRRPEVPHHFSLRGTGHDATGVGDYVGTFQLEEGQLVFHLFMGILGRA